MQEVSKAVYVPGFVGSGDVETMLDRLGVYPTIQPLQVWVSSGHEILVVDHYFGYGPTSGIACSILKNRGIKVVIGLSFGLELHRCAIKNKMFLCAVVCEDYHKEIVRGIRRGLFVNPINHWVRIGDAACGAIDVPYAS